MWTGNSKGNTKPQPVKRHVNPVGIPDTQLKVVGFEDDHQLFDSLPSNIGYVVFVEVIATALHVLSLGVATGGYVAMLWSPFLLLRPLRPLFHLGPTGQWWFNYLLAATVIGIVHVIAFISLMFVFESSLAPVEILFYGGVGVALLGMIVAGIILPSFNYEWADDDNGYVTSMSLLAGFIWYALITIVPPFILWTMYLARL